MRTLALDIGTRRTGVAYLDDDTGIPLPLDTLHHTSAKQLTKEVLAIIHEKRADRVVIGLPLLPSGAEGEQAQFSRKIGTALEAAGIPIIYKDERYSSPKAKNHKNTIPLKNFDSDAASACSLLEG